MGRPDLVLLDVNLPGISGIEVLKQIKRGAVSPVPIVVLTSSDAEDDIAASYDELANAYLTKPTSMDESADLAEIITEFWFEQVELPPDAG